MLAQNVIQILGVAIRCLRTTCTLLRIVELHDGFLVDSHILKALRVHKVLSAQFHPVLGMLKQHSRYLAGHALAFLLGDLL